jgi:hypothetical protein
VGEGWGRNIYGMKRRKTALRVRNAQVKNCSEYLGRICFFFFRDIGESENKTCGRFSQGDAEAPTTTVTEIVKHPPSPAKCKEIGS